MSHKSTPYSPNFPPSQGYGPPVENKPNEGHSMYPTSPPGYPGPPPSAHPMPMPMPQPGFQPVIQPGYETVHAPGYPPSQGYPQPQVYPQSQGYPPVQPYPPAQGYPQPQGYVQQERYPVVVHQPVSQGQPGGWMSIPQGLSNCPPGLEYLSMIDQLLIHQKVELLEAFVGFETNNKYTIKNSIGQKVYFAVEVNDCCTRNCCGPIRPFDMKILDNFQNEVIHIRRPLACDSCWCPCWLQSMEITAPPGNVIGSVHQEWSIFKPSYVIKNAAGDVVLRLKGPLCTFSICGNIDFKIYSQDGETKVGKITKHWSGLAREVFTDADYFGITFPMDLDVKIKAVLLGVCFLIDFMFFEKSGNVESDRPGML